MFASVFFPRFVAVRRAFAGLPSKVRILTRLMTVIAIAALAITVLFRLSSDSRMAVCILVSVATITLALRSLLTGKIVWALLFLSVLGVFTPFQRPQFSNLLISVLDMATLALFAASPMILRKPIRPVVVNVPLEKL